MIIAVTRDNSDLINQVCNTLKHDVQIMNGVTNIKRFAICEMRNLNNYSNIIIDLTGLSDTEEDVIKAVLALKLMYNIRIIIIAIGYEQGDSLLSFTSEVKKSEIATNMKKLGVKAIFSNYMPDPFFMDINENEYKEILSDCIIEKTIKTEILPNQHKKGILSNLRKKKLLFNK